MTEEQLRNKLLKRAKAMKGSTVTESLANLMAAVAFLELKVEILEKEKNE